MTSPNFDYITRAYRREYIQNSGEIGREFAQAANAGDHDFLTRNGWVEVYREDNPGGFTVLYKRANSLDYPRTRQ